MYRSSRPGKFFGDVFPSEKSGEVEMAAVSCANGNILWCPAEDLAVVSIDGKAPRALLSPYFKEKSEE